MGEGFHLGGCESGLRGLQGREEVAAAGVGAEGIVDRVHEVIEAEDLACAVEGWAREVATGGDVDLGEDGLGDGALEIFRGGREDAVGACERVRDAFAHVADDDLEVG